MGDHDNKLAWQEALAKRREEEAKALAFLELQNPNSKVSKETSLAIREAMDRMIDDWKAVQPKDIEPVQKEENQAAIETLMSARHDLAKASTLAGYTDILKRVVVGAAVLFDALAGARTNVSQEVGRDESKPPTRSM